MKNFTQVLNIVLLVAVAVLFYLHFSQKKACTANPVNKPQGGNGIKIAYFEMDSLQNNYILYKQVIKELEENEQKKRAELIALKKATMEKLKEYQDKGNSMTQAEMAKAQQDMAQREKEYQQAEQMKSSEIEGERFKKLQDVKKHIEDFLVDYNKNKGYAFIISNAAELIYYKDSSYNITSDMIHDLNELYKNKK